MGEGDIKIGPKNYDVFYGQPLSELGILVIRNHILYKIVWIVLAFCDC